MMGLPRLWSVVHTAPGIELKVFYIPDMSLTTCLIVLLHHDFIFFNKEKFPFDHSIGSSLRIVVDLLPLLPLLLCKITFISFSIFSYIALGCLIFMTTST